MKKYLVICQWQNHEFTEVFEGENIDDPKMRERIIYWTNRLGDDTLSDCLCNCDRDDTDIQIKAYLIEKPIDLGDIAGETWDYKNKLEREADEYRALRDEKAEREAYEQLRKKFE